MAGLSTGFKKKLSITPCDVAADGNITVRGAAKDIGFELMLNPSSYKYQKSICYGKSKTIGSAGSENKFASIEPSTVSFDFLIDGTGVVNLPIPGPGSPDVKTQLEDLSKVVYEYVGDNHEPNVVRLLWGSLIFFGRLTSMTTNYTLFKPSGAPLRAKVDMAFKGFMSTGEESLRKNDSSPDLSHRVIFKEGDTLPLLCYRIYKDSAYYAEVADYNNLLNFRNIEAGIEIVFPPLR